MERCRIIIFVKEIYIFIVIYIPFIITNLSYFSYSIGDIYIVKSYFAYNKSIIYIIGSKPRFRCTKKKLIKTSCTWKRSMLIIKPYSYFVNKIISTKRFFFPDLEGINSLINMVPTIPIVNVNIYFSYIRYAWLPSKKTDTITKYRIYI
ncbi:hypothetical protein ES708_26984 [subsurface metagenome]